MIKEYFNYKVKIKDTPFVTETGKKYRNTAALSFLDENKKEIAYIELGFIDSEEIYCLIDQGEAINIDQCYVENFSLNDYRESRNIDKKAYVKLHQFSAYNTFFDSRTGTDFSFSEFDDEYKNFENAHFLNGSVSFYSAIFNQGGINFSYVYFNDGNLDFYNVNFGDGEVNFKNTFFGTGHKNFQDAHFGEGNVLFINTEFNKGDVTFVNSEFKSKRVSFKVARFDEGKIDFHFARFHCKELIFERTEFGNGRVDFRTTEFANAKVSFNRSVFGNGDISFEACQHDGGKISFRKSVWGDGNISFEQAELDNSLLILDNAEFGKGNLSFNNSHIQELSLKSCHLDYYVDLRISKCKLIDLSDTVARDIIDIMPYNFPLDIETINFSGMRLIGRVYLDWRKNNVMKLIYNQKYTNLREKAEQFRILKENFNSAGQYDDEDKAYIQFKRNEAKAILHESVKKHKFSAFWQYPAYAFKMLIFDRMGLYATSPVRVIFSNIIMIFIFSTLFTVIPYMSNNYLAPVNENSTFIEKFGTAAYFSAISYFTVGYGDILPQGAILRFIAGCAGFTGVFMMSYFTVAFVRKILR
jgi:hypothetical protein